ncbi:MAG: flagellar biosynthetic protein FliO [candidate division Zixibacteria bacterium]|nr:flagellar biosynthetic protein FliO [candidate division Zixibacteria bacterium]
MKNNKPKRRSIITVVVIIAVAIVGLLAINTDPVTADRGVNQVDTEDSGMKYETFASSALPALLRMVSALVVVIACIYGAILLLKRLMGRNYRGSGQLRALEVLETTSIAPKKTVSLIRVADKSVLVGVTENGMSVLTELSSDQTAKVMIPEERELQTEEDFASSFGKAWNRLRQTTNFRRNKAALDS